jgi:hypothetical protein
MMIKNGLYMLLGAASVRLHAGVLDNGDGPVLTSWLGSCRGPAFDVVGDEQWPTESQSAIQLGFKGAKGMEALLRAMKLVDDTPVSITAHIHFDNGQWVGYDEAALEYVRDTSYLKVRQTMLDYQAMLEAPGVPLDCTFPSAGDTWKHYKGNEYEVLMLANQYSERPEHPPTVVYRGGNGKVWTKTLASFLRKMTFVSKPAEVECGTLEVPSLGITGVRPGNTWVREGGDFPQSDIDLRYSKESGRCESAIWYGAIHVNGRTTEQVEELRDLIIKGLDMATRDSLEFEGALAKYHEQVWHSAQGIEPEFACVAYDEAGEDVAKELIAMFRGEEKYTHHLDMPPAGPVDCNGEQFAQDQWWVKELEQLSGTGVPVSADLYRACKVAVNLIKATCPPIITPPSEEEKQRFIDAWSAADKPVHPLIQCLHDHGEEIVKRATEMQLETLKKASAQADPTGDHMFERFIKKPD